MYACLAKPIRPGQHYNTSSPIVQPISIRGGQPANAAAMNNQSGNNPINKKYLGPYTRK
jgi:hypothetical protein